MMLRNLRQISATNLRLSNEAYKAVQKRTFLTNDYMCLDAWNLQTQSSVLKKVNLNDFYNVLDQNYSSKGLISAIDVDIFANVIKDPIYMEELKDLLHKLRLSADTGNTLESTHHATVRKYIEFGSTTELINVLKDPLNYGIFLDNYTANILLNKLLTSENYEQAAEVASLVMLQEEYTNEITCTLCLYSCYKYISNYVPPELPPPEEKKNVEEIKIRVKFLRNPYFDDHFDIKDTYTLSGKTLAWISERATDNLSNNLQIIGWLVYKKYEKLLQICKHLTNIDSFRVFVEVINILKKELDTVIPESKELLDNCILLLSTVRKAETSLEESLKIAIENAINKTQKKDISTQEQLFIEWEKLRHKKLEEQTHRLDRAKRIQIIEEKHKMLEEEGQKLWFFENEENLDLQIDDKEKEVKKEKTKIEKSDENYIPPEIVPKRKS